MLNFIRSIQIEYGLEILVSIYVKNQTTGKKTILNFEFNGWSKYQNFKKG